MIIRSAPLFFSLCIFVLGHPPVQAQKGPTATERSCRNSVQDFYNWYVAKLTTGEDEDWDVALKDKPEKFSKKLTQALKNSDIESKADGDPVLDFDPILDTQDMGDRYVVRSLTVKSNQCLANVYGEWSRPVPDKGKGPNVIAELEFERGHWVFTNFKYPADGNVASTDLLTILQVHYHPH